MQFEDEKLEPQFLGDVWVANRSEYAFAWGAISAWLLIRILFGFVQLSMPADEYAQTLGRFSHLIEETVPEGQEDKGGNRRLIAHMVWLSLTLLATACLLLFCKLDPLRWSDAFKFHVHTAAGAAALYLVATMPLFALGKADLHYLLEVGWAFACFSSLLVIRFNFTVAWITCSLISAVIAAGARGCAGLIFPTLIVLSLGVISCVSSHSRERTTRRYYVSILNSTFFIDHFRVLLSNLMPPVAVDHLLNSRRGEGSEFGRFFSCASVLFVGVKLQDAPLTSKALLEDLNAIFAKLDAVVADHPTALKIKTVCGVYIVAAGIPEASTDHTEVLALLALKMQAAAASHRWSTGAKLRIRFGVHTGPLCAGERERERARARA